MLKIIKNTIKGALMIVIPAMIILTILALIMWLMDSIPIITMILCILICGYFVGRELDKN